MRKYLLPLALLSALLPAVAALTGCGSAAESKDLAVKAEAAPAIPVEVAAVATGDLDATYAATANLEAEREAVILAELPGEVVQVLVEEGDRVVAGQVLARLDGARTALELRQAQGVVNRLEHEARRNEKLLERHMVSREAADRTRFDRDSQRAAVDLVRLTLGKTEIRAPYAGVITRRHVKQGQWLTAQSPTFEIADFQRLEARLDVPERQAQLLRPGQPVRFTADALGEGEFVATVERVAPVVDRASGTVAVTVAVDAGDTGLRPGLFVRLAIAYDHVADATLLPKHALISDDGENRVFVVDQGVARERRIQLGHENGNAVQVLAGLEPGASVVTVGQAALKDGDRVEIVGAGVDAAAGQAFAAAP